MILSIKEKMSILWLNRACRCIIRHTRAKTKTILRVGLLCTRYLRTGKLPIPNDEDYTFDTNTYDGEFYQADGLQGSFEIVLPGVTTAMEVDNEMVDDDPRDVVLNPKDIQMLE
jgi:hypothetical protein